MREVFGRCRSNAFSRRCSATLTVSVIKKGLFGGLVNVHGLRRSPPGWVMYPEDRKFSRAMGLEDVSHRFALGLD